MREKAINRRESLLRLARLGGGLIVGPPFLTGCSALVKRMFPSAFNLTRDKNNSYDDFIPKIEFPENATFEEMQYEINNIEKFPDAIQKMLVDYGTKFIVFDGKLKDQKIYLDYQRKVSFNIKEIFENAIEETGNLKGVYLPMDKTAMWKLGSEETNMYCPPSKHEIAHAIDWAGGNLFSDYGMRISDADKNFLNIYDLYKNNEDNPSKKSDFFANSVGAFYNSDFSRQWLKENYTYGRNFENPSSSMYGFAKNLERKISEEMN